MKQRRVTQKDVAALAGVSQAMVSMTLNGGVAAVPGDTRERIQAAAARLGYVPNRFAQALKTNRTMTLACIVPDITNPFYPALIRGIQSAAEGHGYDVLAVNTDGDPSRERHVLDWSRQGRVDGVVGVFWTLKASDFASVLEAGVPVVRIESTRKRSGNLPLDDIYVDSQAASLAMTRLLLGRGHQRVAMIAGRGGPQGARVEGYRAALAEAGLAPDVVLDDAFNEEGGARAARTLLAREPRPTAIVAANDLMAIGAMQAIGEAGLRVPDDVAVAGFDDISAARLVSPGLTTVAQFQGEVGARAAQIVLARLRGEAPEAGSAVEMPFRLIERGST
jgi:LacI family transcriptional regulator